MFRKFTVLAFIFLALFLIGCSDDECPTCNQDGPILTLNKHKVDFGAAGTTATFVISNDGSGSLPWDLQIGYRFAEGKRTDANHGGWLALSTAAGEGDATVTLTTNRAELDEFGEQRAVIIVNAETAVNTVRDSIEVFILNAGTWLVTDDGTFEDCAEVDSLDYYWVNGFHVPDGMTHCFVDSIALNFCEADTIVSLLGFDAVYDETSDAYLPDFPIGAGTGMYEVSNGWNVLPADWYIPEGMPVFFVGYFQPGFTRPRLNIDTSSDIDTSSWKARLLTSGPNAGQLQWQWDESFETFAIRAFVSPVLEYNPKMIAQNLRDQAEATLRTGFAYKGRFPMSVQPKRPF